MLLWSMIWTFMVVESLASSCMEFSQCLCVREDNLITNISCTNLGLENDGVLNQMTFRAPAVKSITFTGNFVTELRSNIFGDCRSGEKLNEVTFIDMSDNNIQIIHGQTFHCVPNVETLKLSNNLWYVDPSKDRVFSSMPKLRSLYLDNAFNSTLDHMVHLKQVFGGSNLKFLEELHLENNDVTYIFSDIFIDIPNLKKLFLSGNYLNKIRINLPPLTELYLANNGFNFLTKSDMENIPKGMPNLKVLDLRNNPFWCTDCTNYILPFKAWLEGPHSGMVIAKEHLVCVNPKNLNGTKITALTQKKLKGTCYNPEFVKQPNVSVIVLSVIFSVVGVLFVVIMFLNRNAIGKRLGNWTEPLRNKIRRSGHFGYATMDNMDNVAVET